MLCYIKRNLFHVVSAADTDVALAMPAATVAALGYTLTAPATGLVAYGPENSPSTVNAEVAAPAASPDITIVTYSRHSGLVVDVAASTAIALIHAGILEMVVGHVSPTQSDDIDFCWLNGTIAGEVTIPVLQAEQIVSAPAPNSGSSSTLVAESWVADPRA